MVDQLEDTPRDDAASEAGEDLEFLAQHVVNRIKQA